MAIRDPWLDTRVRDHLNDIHERIDVIEESMPETDTDSLDDDQLSRLGINNVVPDEPRQVITGIDLARSAEAVTLTDQMVGIMGSTTTIQANNVFNSLEPIEIETPTLEVRGRSHFREGVIFDGPVDMLNGVDIFGDIRYRGLHIDEYVRQQVDANTIPLETRITELEGIIRRLTEDNGQDDS